MAIYAKIKMDELPKSCKTCCLSERMGEGRRCILNGSVYSRGGRLGGQSPVRSCPLIKVEEE